MKKTKSKLSLDHFKAKLGSRKESLELISGGILGAGDLGSNTLTVEY